MRVYLNFEDHGSLYEIDASVAEDLQAMYDVDDMAAHIVECGVRLCVVPLTQDIYFDTTNPTVDNMTEFLDDIATALAEQL